MTGFSLGWEPIVPSQRARQTDREYIAGLRRRTTEARLKPYNRVLAAEASSQTAGLSRTVQALSDRAERRSASRGIYERIRARTSDEEALERYRAERGEQLAVIARARGGSPGGSVSRSAVRAALSSPDAERCSGPGCAICAWGREQDASRGRPASRVRSGGTPNAAPYYSPGGSQREIYR